MKIAVIADPHIGVTKDAFVPNWQATVAHVNAMAADLIVILGDLTLDGANSDEDCAFARDALRALDAPCLVLPGNHDVGDVARDSFQPTDASRLARWEKHFGADRWIDDSLPGWRLIGIDSQILDTGLAEEAAQWEFLDAAFAGAGERLPILFSHRPMFLHDWNEEDRPYWAAYATSRARIRALATRYGAKAIVSGHVHRTLVIEAPSEPKLVWAAASSFLAKDESMPQQDGAAMLGVTCLDLADGAVGVRLEPVAGLERYFIEDFAGSIYPAPK